LVQKVGSQAGSAKLIEEFEMRDGLMGKEEIWPLLRTCDDTSFALLRLTTPYWSSDEFGDNYFDYYLL
jgi:hypothetical protein